MGTDAVNLICVPANKLNQANATNQSSPIQQQSNNDVFKLPANLKPGDKVVFVAPDGNKTVYQCGTEVVAGSETSCNESQTADIACANPCANNFGSLTMFDNTDLGSMILNLNRQSVQTAGASQAQNNTASQAGNNIYDIAFQKAVDKLTKKLDKGEITEKEFITQVKDLKKEIKTYAKEEITEDEAEVNEQRDEKLSAPQKDAIKKFLSGSDNKTFTREDIKQHPEISGAQTATQNIGNNVIDATFLADGTIIEIKEDGDKKGAWGAVKRFCTAWQTNNIFTALITRPDGSKETIKANSREDINNKVYKSIGILKGGNSQTTKAGVAAEQGNNKPIKPIAINDLSTIKCH